MKPKDQNRLNHSRRLLHWGTPALSLLVWPPLLFLLFEESWGLKALFAWRGELGPPEDVVVVAFDEESDDLLDQPDRRALFAEVVERLTRGGASIIVLDLFLESESVQDSMLASRFGDARNVILTARLDDRDMQIRPLVQLLARNALAVAPFPVPVAGFRVDWVPIRFDLNGEARYSIPFVTLQAYIYDETVSLLRFVQPDEAMRYPSTGGELPLNGSVNLLVARFAELFRNQSAFPQDLPAGLDAHQNAIKSLLSVYQDHGLLIGNRMYLNFYGGPRTVTTISIQDALDGRFSVTNGTSVDGKAVFVGLSATRQQEQYDDYPFVFSHDGLNISGVELGATAFANLLHGDALRIWPATIRTGLVLFWGTVIAVSFSLLSVRMSALVALLLFSGYLLFASHLFNTQNLWLPIVVPGIQVMFAGLFSLRAKHLGEVRDNVLLEKGMSQEAAQAARGRGKSRTVDERIVLYCDQKGSTAWLLKATENLSRNERAKILHEYEKAWLEPIERYGGEIIRPITDSAQAFWRLPKDAQAVGAVTDSACRAVLAMRDGIGAFNHEHEGYKLPLRMGLDRSEIIAQWIPEPVAHWRMDGMAVNTSVRLESLNKLLKTWVLVSERIAERVDKTDFWTPRLGTFEFYNDDGEKELNRVSVHELEFMVNVSPELRELGDKLEAALSAIEELRWSSAIEILERIKNSIAYGDLIRSYLGWCRQSLSDTTDCDWKGVVKVTLSGKSQALDRLMTQ